MGDILEWPEQKQAGKVMFHAGIIAPNLISFLEGKPQKKVYKGTPEGIIIPIGKVCSLPLVVVCPGLTVCTASWSTIFRYAVGDNIGSLGYKLVQGEDLVHSHGEGQTALQERLVIRRI